MRVIFLDIDGVLNSEDFFVRTKGGAGDIDPIAVARLRCVVESVGAQIVLSAGRRRLDRWQARMLEGLGGAGWVGAPIIDRTPPQRDDPRGERIREWLSRHRVEQFCIIDDDMDMLPEQMEHFVMCNWRHGLTDAEAWQVLSHFF